MRVLIADDSKDAADTLAALLELWGHEAQVTYDGAAALAAACPFRPQVALLDVQMPKLNGCEVARRLRRLPSFGGIIVATSAFDPDDTRLGEYGDAFDGFLVKPCNLDHLRELLSDRCSYAAS